MFKSRKTETVLIIFITIVAVVVVYTVLVSVPTKNFSLDVDALKDSESLFTNARVVLKNTGTQPLNDIVIIFDKNMNITENLIRINPGEQIIISPPSSASLESVQVITSEGISIQKEFRSPIKMPGMIGS